MENFMKNVNIYFVLGLYCSYQLKILYGITDIIDSLTLVTGFDNNIVTIIN